MEFILEETVYVFINDCWQGLTIYMNFFMIHKHQIEVKVMIKNKSAVNNTSPALAYAVVNIRLNANSTQYWAPR